MVNIPCFCLYYCFFLNWAVTKSLKNIKPWLAYANDWNFFIPFTKVADKSHGVFRGIHIKNVILNFTSGYIPRLGMKWKKFYGV